MTNTDTLITDLYFGKHLDVRIQVACKNYDLVTVGDLMKLKDDEIIRMAFIWKKSLVAIRKQCPYKE